MHKHMTEEDVGIRCYITSGFTPIPGMLWKLLIRVQQSYDNTLYVEITDRL